MDDPRYHTAQWKKLRAIVLRESPLCHYCKQAGRVTVATTVDHATPIARGGEFFDRANLRSACENCNYSKRDQTEDEFLVKGCDVNGIPLSPNHPWRQAAHG